MLLSRFLFFCLNDIPGSTTPKAVVIRWIQFHAWMVVIMKWATNHIVSNNRMLFSTSNLSFHLKLCRLFQALISNRKIMVIYKVLERSFCFQGSVCSIMVSV